MSPLPDGYEATRRKLIVLRGRKLRLAAQLRCITADRHLWSLLAATRAIRQRQEEDRARVLRRPMALHLCFRRKRGFLEHAAFSMHFVSFVLLSSVTLVVAISARHLIGRTLFLILVLVGLWQFAYLAVAIRRFYLAGGRWSGWLLSVTAALLLYILNSAFMTGVQVAGASIALALS